MAHRVLERSRVQDRAKVRFGSFNRLRPDGLGRRDDEVEGEADDTNNFRGRYLSAHEVKRGSGHVPGADVSTSSRADALRVQLEAMSSSESRRQLGRKVRNFVNAVRYVRPGGDTIVHAAPVSLAVERRSYGKRLVGITAVSGVEDVSTTLHEHVEVVVVGSVLESGDVSC